MSKEPKAPQKTVEAKATPPAAPTNKSKDLKVEPQPVATKVYIHVVASGKTGALAAIPLHEVPLLRRKLHAYGESLTLVSEWPKSHPRERALMRTDLESEFIRLQENYIFTPPDSNEKVDLVGDFLGPFQGGRHLIEMISNLHGVWQKLAAHCASEEREPTPEEILEVIGSADPQAIESEMIEDT